MGTLITQTPPSSPYDYSPHVLANSPHRIYRGILVILAGLFHPPFFPLKITRGFTFQLNPRPVTELNLSWEETWLCFPCLFCAIKRVILTQVCIKGIKSLLVCRVRGKEKWNCGRNSGDFEGSSRENNLSAVYQRLVQILTITFCLLHCFFFLLWRTL